MRCLLLLALLCLVAPSASVLQLKDDFYSDSTCTNQGDADLFLSNAYVVGTTCQVSGTLVSYKNVNCSNVDKTGAYEYYYNPDLSPNLDCNTVAPNTFSMYSTNMRTTTASFNSTTNVTSYTYSWVQPSNTFGFSASSNPSSTNYIDQCIKYTDTTWRKFTCVDAPLPTTPPPPPTTTPPPGISGSAALRASVLALVGATVLSVASVV